MMYLAKVPINEVEQDNYEKQHGERVAKLSLEIAEHLCMSKSFTYNLYLSAIYHDVGKRHIPEEILNYPGKLPPHQKEIVNDHVIYSALDAITAGYSASVIRSIFYHHKDYCGGGYPTGIMGNKIPLGARIIRVCDYFDALVSDRPYRSRMSLSLALTEMQKDKHKFDPAIFGAFLKINSKEVK